MKNVLPPLEPLEPRIAPATFTYADVDGDFVTIRTSKGLDTDLSAPGVITLAPEGLGFELQEIDLSADATVFAGTDLSVTARRTSVGGDGRVNVGFIDADGSGDGDALHLGKVRVGGDLGQIDVGPVSAPLLAVKSLHVQSMGEFGIATQGAGASLASFIRGSLGSLFVAGSIREANLEVEDGRIGSVTVGGSLIGGAATDSGRVGAEDAIGLVKIAGNIEGGGGSGSGNVESFGTLAGLTLGGSLIGSGALDGGAIYSNDAMGFVKIAGNIVGGAGSQSGNLRSHSGTLAGLFVGGSVVGGTGPTSAVIFSDASMGPVRILGNLEGGSGSASGVIESGGALAAITLGGSLIGGTNSSTGIIRSDGNMGPVRIGGNIDGGDITAAGTLEETGVIQAQRIASLFVGGSIFAGTASGGGTVSESGAVRVDDDLGPITVRGSLVGNADNHVLITARGQATPGAASDFAIKSLFVGGRVEFTDILAGYNTNDTPRGVNADAQIGAVIVGDWIASSLVAGAQDNGTAAFDSFFGDADDVKIIEIADAPGIVSKIASILIKGSARGTLVPADHYGFVAQQIGSFKIGTTAFPLIPGAASTADLAGYAIGITGDLRIREVGL